MAEGDTFAISALVRNRAELTGLIGADRSLGLDKAAADAI